MILHLFKNDLRHVRVWLLAWGGLLAVLLLMILGLRMPLGKNLWYWDFLRFGFLVGILIQLFFQSILVIKNVQKENLQNAQSYWLTRPIGRGHLLASKLLFWLLVILLPQVVQFTLLGASFLGGWEGALHGAGAILLAVSLLGFLSVLAASASKDVGQALLFLLVTPFGLLLAGRLFAMSLGQWFSGERILYSLTVIPFFESLLILAALCLGLFFYWQQLHESSRRWRHRVACVGVLALFFLAAALPKVEPVPTSTMSLPEGAFLDINKIMFTRTDRPFPGSSSGHVDYSIQLWRDKPSGSDYGLKAMLEWRGLPAEWLVHSQPVRSYDAEGRWLRNVKKLTRSRYSDQIDTSDNLIIALFPDSEIVERARFGDGYHHLFSSPMLNVREVNLPAEFTTVFANRFYSLEKVRLPIDSEAEISLGETRLRLERVVRQGNALVLKFDYLEFGQLGRQFGDVLKNGYFVLHDPVTAKVAIGRQNSRNATTAFGLLTVGQCEVSFKKMNPSTDVTARMELYYVKQHLIGTFVAPVQYTVSSEE